MRKNYFLIVIAFMCFANLSAQKTNLLLWDFRGANGTGSSAVVWVQSLDNSLSPDSCGTNNASAEFNSEQANTNRYLKKASDAIDGFAISTNWGNPNVATGDLYWYIYNVNTIGFSNIGVNYQQWSSNTGPGRFNVQARVGSDGLWTTLNSTPYALTDGRTVTTKYFTFPLPEGCANQSRIDIRFIRADDYQVNGTTVISSGGMSRIDNIRIYGEPIVATGYNNKKSNFIKVAASNGKIKILGAKDFNATIYSVSGIKVFEVKKLDNEQEILLPSNSIYIVKVNNKAYKVQL